jgi:hypothetical protein
MLHLQLGVPNINVKHFVHRVLAGTYYWLLSQRPESVINGDPAEEE